MRRLVVEVPAALAAQFDEEAAAVGKSGAQLVADYLMLGLSVMERARQLPTDDDVAALAASVDGHARLVREAARRKPDVVN